jgi:hypothetical protein
MNEAQLTAIIVGITGIIRTRFPRVDGLVVPLVAMAIGAALAVLAEPVHWREALVRGIGIALTAIGAMTALGYAGTKIGAGAASLTHAPTETTDETSPRDTVPTRGGSDG